MCESFFPIFFALPCSAEHHTEDNGNDTTEKKNMDRWDDGGKKRPWAAVEGCVRVLASPKTGPWRTGGIGNGPQGPQNCAAANNAFFKMVTERMSGFEEGVPGQKTRGGNQSPQAMNCKVFDDVGRSMWSDGWAHRRGLSIPDRRNDSIKTGVLNDHRWPRAAKPEGGRGLTTKALLEPLNRNSGWFITSHCNFARQWSFQHCASPSTQMLAGGPCCRQSSFSTGARK